MRNLYKITLLGLFLLFFGTVRAGNKEDSNSLEKIVNHFISERKNTAQEKVYLQTDKPYYSAGEDIWFKGYLVNAATNVPKSLSRYLYVELIDKSDSVFSRIKILKDSLGFAGCIKLKPEMPAGNYVLRAYTYWMQNVSSDFFFKKNIYIGNNIDDHVLCQINYGIPINGKIPVNLTFTNSYKTPYKAKKFNISQNWKSSGRKNITLTTNNDGKIFWQIEVDSTNHSDKTITASIADPDLKYSKKFYVPEFSSDFDVQFFPESGVLLSDNLQTVAFKAIGSDGLSVDVTGKLYTDKDEEVTEFSSINKGMGKFIVETKSGENYYAVIKSSSGKEKKFNLPTQQTRGVSIHLGFNKNRILYEIVNHTEIPTNSLSLLVHVRGIVLVLQPLKYTEGQISGTQLPAGIVSFSVIDSLGNTYCERLAFIPNFNLPTVNMTTDKTIYSKREPVNLNLNIQSLLGKSVSGTYSISVTDSKTVKLDSINDNILSYLLLSSDIKGYIEDPASYFSNNLIITREKTDILMLTQGWRRFSTAAVVKGLISKPKFYMEAGQALSGKVLNILNKPSVKCDVTMLSSYRSMFKFTKTDSTGNYLIDGIEFPDSTTFILKARKKKTFGDVEILPDPDVFPKVSIFIPNPKNTGETPPSDYFNQTKEKYYTEGGMRVVNLDEITVTASKKSTDDSSDFYSGMANTQINSESLDKYPGMNILSILQTVPGVMVMGDQISIRGSQGNPMFLIDGIEAQDMEDITYLTTNDVDNIAVFKGADAAIFGSRGGNGVIAITLKKGVTLKASTPISLATIMPLGYQKPTEFYVPKYEVDSIRMNPKSDLRTTIYWNPKLVTDSTGTIHVKFYTADKANNYSVVLEGITCEGEICRYQGILKREDK